VALFDNGCALRGFGASCSPFWQAIDQIVHRREPWTVTPRLVTGVQANL